MLAASVIVQELGVFILLALIVAGVWSILEDVFFKRDKKASITISSDSGWEGESPYEEDNRVFFKQSGKLFSPAERNFLGILDQVIGQDFRIFGKVRLADLVEVTEGLTRSNWQSKFNQICSKHIDFVICRKTDLSVVLLVELDDKSHLNKKRIRRDEFVDQCLESAGVALLRIPARSSYSLTLMREKIEQKYPSLLTTILQKGI